MAEKGSNNWLWWTIGGIATLGLGLGIYYYLRSGKDATAKEEEEKKKASSQNTYNPPVNTNTNPSPSPSPSPAETYPLKSTPFTSTDQSNAFRAWVNAKDPAFANKIELEMNKSNPKTMNNETIQKAWAKFSDMYYSENFTYLSKVVGTSGIVKTDGGILWKSVDSAPRGEINMFTDGKITVNAVNANGAQTKFNQGGWYVSGNQYKIRIDKEDYSVGTSDITNAFWSILKKAGIYNNSSQSYSAFNSNMSTTKFGMITDGTNLQDVML
jgi:hypothetical protein